MRPGVSISLTDADCERLDAIVRDQNSPQKHVWRALVVLLTAAGLGNERLMRETGKSKTCVWRWQEQFMTDGVTVKIGHQALDSIHSPQSGSGG